MPQTYLPHPDKVSAKGCICIIGMAAAGKTTIGRELSQIIGWPQLDADHLIEAAYGAGLQEITDRMSKEDFLDLEARVIREIKLQHAIISTGGSVVYRREAMEHLAGLGPVIYIDVPLPIILERIAKKPERGLAIAPGQTLEDLFYERKALYEHFADHVVEGGRLPPAYYAERIACWLSSPGARRS